MRFLSSVIVLLVSLLAQVAAGAPPAHQPAHHWYGRGFDAGRWPNGYWFHGTYLDHYGWWWVVGPTWYFYTEPISPYPPLETAPIYIAQVPDGAPPPGTAATQAPAGPANATGTPPPPPPPYVASAPSSFYYYCAKARAYFPAATECAEGWIVVPSAPARQFALVPVPIDTDTSKEAVVERPNAVTLELFGRALLYSFDYDRAISDHVSLGIGASDWKTGSWWHGYYTNVVVVPVYSDFYFSQDPNRGYLSAGFDWVHVSQSGYNSNTFANSGFAGTAGGGFEHRGNSGFVFRFGGYVIVGKSVDISPALNFGFGF